MIPLSLEYNGVKKTFAAWGYGPPVMRLLSQGVSTVTVPKVGDDPTNAADIPYMGLVKIYGTLAGMNGGLETIIFQGRRTDYAGIAGPDARSTTMVISDGWWDLKNITFQHYWSTRAPGGGANANAYFARLMLFQDISAGPASPYSFLSATAQIQEIVNFAQTSCGGNLQIGTVDPAWNLPPYAVKAISCAEALLVCLKFVPDAVTFFDYTFNPPKLHIRQRPNCAAITLPFDGVDAHGRNHKSSRIKPLPELQAGQVVLQYMKVNNVNGTNYVYFDDDVYPPGSTGLAIGALVVPIDLRGGSRTDLTAKITSATIDPTTTAFWVGKKPDLGDVKITNLALVNTNINDGSTDCITVLDDAGNPVTISDYGYELTDGSVTPWMKLGGGGAVTTKKVTITAVLKYKEKRNTTANTVAGQPWLDLPKHPVSVRVTLTNSPSTTQTYSALAHFDPGEDEPSGLAHTIYNTLSTLQWEGEHEIVEGDIYSIVTPGMVLNLSGGAAAWAAMNAVITAVEIDFFHGRTTVSFGPEKHLSPAELFEKIMMWRYRFVYDNPNLRNTGEVS